MHLRLAAFFLIVFALPAQQQFADLGDFRLQSGEVIRKARLGYRTAGTLNPAKTNAIFFPTWFSGRTEDLEQYIGPGKLADTDRFFVITMDAWGNGVSSSPSMAGKKRFPRFTIRDMVNAGHQLVTGRLGITRLHAVMGISMGGMQTFEWIAAYPDMMDRAVPIIGSPRLATSDLLLWNTQLRIIEQAEKCKCNPREAMKTVAAVHRLALETPGYRNATTPAGEFAAYRDSFEKTAGVRVTAQDWASQLRAMISHDIAPGLSLADAAGKVKAKVMVVVATQDHMVHPAPALELAGLLRARILRLEGDCGHMAPGCETGQFTAAVRAFLAE